MISKEIFKEEVEKLFEVHCCKEKATVNMLRYWFEECQELEEEEFKVAINRARYAETEPKLYHILINLPRYEKTSHKSIADYLGKVKSFERERVYYGF